MDVKDLFTKTGKINSAILRREWFLTSQLWKDIKEVGIALGGCENNASELIFLYQTRNHRPKCIACDNLAAFKSSIKAYASHCGSRSCSQIAAAQKRIETNLRRYGSKISPKTYEAARSRSGELNRKGRETLKQRYGIENPGQMADHLRKTKETMLKKYGADNPASVGALKGKFQESSIEFYSKLCSAVKVIEIKNPPSSKFATPCKLVTYTCDFHGDDFIPTETFKWRAKRFNTVCSKCLRPYANSSIAQNNLAEWIESLGHKIRFNDRQLISPLELDITIPEKKIAIEYHGLFWHSTGKLEEIDRQMHVKKINMMPDQWQLIQIFEDEWIYKQEIVKSILRSKLNHTTRIFARNCQIDLNVSSIEAKSFLEKNHLQGSINSKIRIGLRSSGELVAIACFGSSRFEKNTVELLRFACKLNTTIVGGLSKLLKASKLKEVVSYCDRRYSTGKGYLACNFQLVGISEPGYFYTDRDRRFSRFKFQKHKLARIVGAEFDHSLTEVENVLRAGYRIIPDAGQLKFKWRL